MVRIEEKAAWKANGFLFLLIAFALLIGSVVLLINEMLLGIVLLLAFALTIPGFVMNQPNEVKVLTFFGKYIGTIREDGFFWANPFAIKKKVSVRVRNFDSEKLKVNDADGNPIIIGAVVVWKVVDSAKALFDVEDYAGFVALQSEAAIRALANHYPYDSHSEEKPSLRSAPDEVAEALRNELKERLEFAGVDILEARISHLAYAPEIAQVMLRRQQAQAVISARQQMVEGAMGMVEAALKRLEEHGVVDLDEERKAAMVNNLMVALVSEGQTQPVINTGTLYT